MENIPTVSERKILDMSRMDLVCLMRQTGLKNLDEQIIFLKQHLQTLCKYPENLTQKLNRIISHFSSQYKTKWAESNRTHERFVEKNENWLQTVVQFPIYDEYEKKNRGRQTMSFAETSDCSKRKKTRELRENFSLDELSYATQMNLRLAGKIEASKLVKEITTTTPKRAERYRKAFLNAENQKTSTMTGEEALSVLIEAKLSRHQYEVIRSKDKKRFPSYKIVQKSKNACYPKQEFITASADCVQVDLQELLNHTASRLVSSLSEVISLETSSNDVNNLQIIYKWGFDGSSGLNPYKQKNVESQASDCSVFLSSLIPLQLVKGDINHSPTVLWQNPRPSSTRYCRPIRIQFKKETTELSKSEKDYIDNQIQSLQPTIINFESTVISVKHCLIFAMIDGKICNALTDTKATQKCYLCGATSKQFNELNSVLKRKVVPDFLQLGLSILHSWIRFFECLLHISYKLPIKSWQARGEEAKHAVSENKKRIQKEFQEKMGLLVDRPKPGFGNSNDGNTARRFFQNSELSASITGIDCTLIQKFHIILITISSGFHIDVDKFRSFCIDTAKLYVQKYHWYCMPPTIHKILIHGPEVIEKSLLPIGQLSEEAQEARNKDLKKYREDFSRKCDRAKTNKDIFCRLLVSSDPIITGYRPLPKKKIKNFPKEVLNMILPAFHEIGKAHISESSSESSNSEEED